MALPIMKHPTFELTIPSTKATLKYRPFLVKEEKILLLAQGSTKSKDLILAVKQIVNNCIIEGDINIDSTPTFDLEYIFLKLRANSVSDIAKFNMTEDDGEESKIEIDLNDVEVQHTENHTNMVALGNDVSLEMKYPSYTTLSNIKSEEAVDVTFEMIEMCIDKVVQGEEVMELKDFSKAEVKEFLDSLTSQNFRDIQKFFDEMPKLQHTVEYKVGKKTKSRTFTGLADFFQSA
tara:strand:- start:267 stop:968 length:702 start_codon:yes stop_codon:yes gene_type:complete